MRFEEKLKLVDKAYNGICNTFIVIGENIIPSVTCIEKFGEQDKMDTFFEVEEQFHQTDVLVPYLTNYWREAFDNVAYVGRSTFYIAGSWEARIIMTRSVLFGVKNHFRWLEFDYESDLLCALSWHLPLSEHEVARKTNLIFGDDLYAIYDVMPFKQVEHYDINICLRLVARRYISIDKLPVDVLKQMNSTIQEAELMENDIARLFNCQMELTSTRVKTLKVSDIIEARILAMESFESVMKKLLPDEESVSEETQKADIEVTVSETNTDTGSTDMYD